MHSHRVVTVAICLFLLNTALAAPPGAPTAQGVVDERVVYTWGRSEYPAVITSTDGTWADLVYIDTDGSIKTAKSTIADLAPAQTLNIQGLSPQQRRGDPYLRLEQNLKERQSFAPQPGDRVGYVTMNEQFPAVLTTSDGKWVDLIYLKADGTIGSEKRTIESVSPVSALEPTKLSPRQRDEAALAKLDAAAKATINFNPQPGDRVAYIPVSFESAYPAILLSGDHGWFDVRFLDEHGGVATARAPASMFRPVEWLEPGAYTDGQKAVGDVFVRLGAPDAVSSARDLSKDAPGAGVQLEDRRAALAALKPRITVTHAGGEPRRMRASLSTDAASALIAYRDEKERFRIGTVQVIDLVDGKATAAMRLPEGREPMDVSPDGERLLLLGVSLLRDDRASVDIAVPAAGEARVLFSFKPYDGESEIKRTVESARLIAADRAACVSRGWSLTIWSLDDTGAQAMGQLDGVSVIEPVGDGRHLLAATSRNVLVIDTRHETDGVAVVASYPAPFGVSDLAVTPDGKRLVVLARDHLTVIDLAGGATTLEAGLPVVDEQSGITGMTVQQDGALFELGDGSRMILRDLRTGAAVMRFNVPKGATVLPCSAGVAVLGTTVRNDARLLVLHPVPDDAAAQAAAPNVIFRAGDALRLEPTFDASAETKQDTLKRLTDSLQQRGLTLSDQSADVLQLASATGPAIVKQYRRGFEEPQTVSTNAVNFTAKLVIDGRTVWCDWSSWTPSNLVQGATAAQAVEASRNEAMRWFGNVHPPLDLLEPQDEDALPQVALPDPGAS